MALGDIYLYALRYLLSLLQNVNTVDVIMPTWPILLYSNPTLGKYLLLGLLEYQATGQYPNAWAAHDLGWFIMGVSLKSPNF